MTQQISLISEPELEYAVMQDFYGWPMVAYSSVSLKKCQREEARRRALGYRVIGIASFPREGRERG